MAAPHGLKESRARVPRFVSHCRIHCTMSMGKLPCGVCRALRCTTSEPGTTAMRARYTVLPKAGYIMETFYGAVTFAQFEDFLVQQHQDSRILPQLHTISDFTQATLRLTISEVEELVSLICRPSNLRTGKRALVINGSRNFAFADVFRSRIQQAEIVSQ